MSLVPAFRDKVSIVPLKETFGPRELSIITRRNSPRSGAALCFIECLLKVIRRHARSAKKEERQLFDTLQMLI